MIKDERGVVTSAFFLLIIPFLLIMASYMIEHSQTVFHYDLSTQQAVTEAIRAAALNDVDSASQANGDPMIKPDDAYQVFKQVLAENLNLDPSTLAPQAGSGLSAAPEIHFVVFNGSNSYGLPEGVVYPETITISGSNGASAQAEVRFTVNEALSFAIGAAPNNIAFDSLAQGYLTPDAKTVTVTNTGNQSISLYQPTASRYTIGTLSATGLAPAGTATFTIVPKDGLAAGTWNETIHILGSNGVNAQVDAAFTCTVPLDYFIISGDGSTFQQEDTDPSSLTITANGDIHKFTGLTLNGELVDESNYDVTEGSTIVTLHQDFLDTLIPGTYTLSFVYTDGIAEAEFVVQDRMPATGDNDALVLFGSLTVLCLFALALIKKSRHIGRKTK
jgi:hypothetical protein